MFADAAVSGNYGRLSLGYLASVETRKNCKMRTDNGHWKGPKSCIDTLMIGL